MSGMPYADLTEDDFLGAVNALLPQGPCFPRDPNSWQSKFFSAIALFFWQLHSDIVKLFDKEFDPGETEDLLSDWQDAYGITPRGSEDNQRSQLVSVITDPGGFTGAHYVALAATLGISITATATGPFTWTVTAPSTLIVDDRLALEALINMHNRASCIVSFVYGSGGGMLDFSTPDNSALDSLL